jgi:hypothetical protein
VIHAHAGSNRGAGVSVSRSRTLATRSRRIGAPDRRAGREVGVRSAAVTKAWKHIVFVAGLVGVIGMFTPLLEIRHGIVGVELSAKELTFGFQGTHALLNRELPKVIEKRLPASIRTGRDDARLIAQASKHAALMYIPAALLLLLGLFGLATRRPFSRPFAAMALLFGLASIATYIGLRIGLRLGLEEAMFKRTTVELLNGAALLLVAGLGGTFAGIGALVKPEQRGHGQRSRQVATTSPVPPGPPPKR